MQILLRTLTAVAFLSIGLLVSMKLFSKDEDKEEAPKYTKANSNKSGKGKGGKKPTKKTKTKVEGGNIKHKNGDQETTVIALSPSDYQVRLLTQGIVRPRTETNLNALVPGNITHISKQLQDGAFFKKGDLLVELDPTDYASRIITAKASLARAQASLAQEKARAAQALRNWQDIGFDEEPNDLVLRKPQLNEASANVAAQQAGLDKAIRDLERTKIYAPFDGRIRKRNVGPGESIGANSSLADIYTTDYAEIRLPLSARQLTQIDINEQGDQAIPVDLTDALNDKNETIWKAVVKHVEGELDEVSRELNVIAHIPDPFGTSESHPPLRMNQPVKASITAKKIKGAYVIDRKFLYGSNEILLVDEGAILRKKIDIAWSTTESVITTDPDLAGKLLATSRINYAKDGMPINIIEDDEKEATDPAAEKGKEANKSSVTSL